ncbi:hypothetical protein C8Q76DRAFT_145799 [Earliella scabrosa]|nr:hypothetical protein C8Q76DRAFT_145799 [Earliella scabrosa]
MGTFLRSPSPSSSQPSSPPSVHGRSCPPTHEAHGQTLASNADHELSSGTLAGSGSGARPARARDLVLSSILVHHAAPRARAGQAAQSSVRAGPRLSRLQKIVSMPPRAAGASRPQREVSLVLPCSMQQVPTSILPYTTYVCVSAVWAASVTTRMSQERQECVLITVLLLGLRTTVTDSRVAPEPRTPSDIAHCQWRSLPGGAEMILRENHAPRLSDKLTHRAHMHEGRMLSCAVRTSVYQPDFLAGHEASTRQPPRRAMSEWRLEDGLKGCPVRPDSDSSQSQPPAGVAGKVFTRPNTNMQVSSPFGTCTPLVAVVC